MWQRRTIPAGKCIGKDHDPVPESGIYIVTLTNPHPISVNAQNRKLAERCITVTSANCKVGRARSFQVRERNYWRTFGQQHVMLRPIALMRDPRIAERVILAALREWRIRGRYGRLTEWLEGICAADAERIAVGAMRSAQIRYSAYES